MAIHQYRTLSRGSDGIYKEKGSKFLSFAFPVLDEAEVRDKLVELRKKFYDARHHCYAWVLGPDKKQFRVSDDGEPNHSAGDPILGQIRSRDLTYVLVVVVRYFGGVKLGVGGLVTAYKTAAMFALEKADVVVRDVVEEIQIRYQYQYTPDVMKLIKEFSLTIAEQDFGEVCRMKLICKMENRKVLLERLTLLNATGSTIIFE